MRAMFFFFSSQFSSFSFLTLTLLSCSEERGEETSGETSSAMARQRCHHHASAVPALWLLPLLLLLLLLHLCSPRPCEAFSFFERHHRRHSLSPRSEFLTSGISGDEIVQQVRICLSLKTAVERAREK